MGFSLRKSIKLGKGIRLNLSSKSGIGVSLGTKGARASINKNGINLYGGKGIVRYTKNIGFNQNKKKGD